MKTLIDLMIISFIVVFFCVPNTAEGFRTQAEEDYYYEKQERGRLWDKMMEEAEALDNKRTKKPTRYGWVLVNLIIIFIVIGGMVFLTRRANKTITKGRTKQ